jgi:transcriptional regulator with XRE-family HTH domain
MSATSSSRSNFDAFRAKRLQKPGVKAAYEDARARSGIVDALVRRRRALGLRQTELAQKMDVGQSTVSGFETEGSDPRLSTLQRYARAVDSTLYVHVVPNMPGGQRPNFYVSYPGVQRTAAAHSEPTPRARTWVSSQSPYGERRLRLVPRVA